MLYHLLYPLHTEYSFFNVFRYVTFRTASATLTALAISFVLGPWLIARLRQFQIGQHIRQEGPQGHRSKAGTPTMGGILILAAVVVPTLLWADLTNVFVWVALGTTTAFGLIVAIPLLLVHSLLQSKTAQIVESLEIAMVKFLNLMDLQDQPAAEPALAR